MHKHPLFITKYFRVKAQFCCSHELILSTALLQQPKNNNEQKGGRPWLVLSIEGFNQVTPFVWAVPFTTSERDYPLAYKWNTNSKTSGTLLCDQLTTLDVKHRYYKFIEHVEVPIEVTDKIRAVLNL